MGRTVVSNRFSTISLLLSFNIIIKTQKQTPGWFNFQILTFFASNWRYSFILQSVLAMQLRKIEKSIVLIQYNKKDQMVKSYMKANMKLLESVIFLFFPLCCNLLQSHHHKRTNLNCKCLKYQSHGGLYEGSFFHITVLLMLLNKDCGYVAPVSCTELQIESCWYTSKQINCSFTLFSKYKKLSHVK